MGQNDGWSFDPALGHVDSDGGPVGTPVLVEQEAQSSAFDQLPNRISPIQSIFKHILHCLLRHTSDRTLLIYLE